ncbi:hypothetical protein [Paraglaciecola arctica]|uniref:hypothetical protein n=1 Tax=Paraglaciecola arctica TaxID=1128911 RepID=UPI001C06C98E|nr:hypothetical protein [Paraglaciecola arctica]MBU3005305.1 hypothetical protein [Paraglaciecola arctica]
MIKKRPTQSLNFKPKLGFLKHMRMLLVCLLLGACGSDSEEALFAEITVEFGDIGLDGLISNRVLVTSDGVVVATDKGAYKSIDRGISWELMTPEDWYVLDIIEIDTLHLMISAQLKGSNFLSESFDGGKTWIQLRANFGAENSNHAEQVNRMDWDELTQTLFATGIEVLARSNDRGLIWEVVSGGWNSFGSGMRSVSYSTNQNVAFYGGQGAIENPLLKRVDLSNNSESFIDLTDLLPMPSTIEEIQFDENDDNTLFVSGEGGLITSSDLGETWTPLLLDDDSRFFFDFVKDKRFNDHFYTAGWNKVFDEPQPLILEISQDNGNSWQQFTHPSQTLFGGVRTMDILYEGDEAILFLGLYKGGVIKVLLR